MKGQRQLPIKYYVQLSTKEKLFVLPYTSQYIIFCCSVAKSCPIPCDTMDCRMPVFVSFTVSWSMLKLMFSQSVMLSNYVILCHPVLLLSIFPSICVFSNESALHIRWPKNWSFSISPSNEYSGSISFRIDCFNLLAVQGTLKSLLQHHNSKASIFWSSAFLWSNSHIHTQLLEKP